MPRRKPKSRKRTASQQKAKIRGFAAINRVRKGQSDSLSSAAKAEGTTVNSIKELLPAALVQDRPGGRIQVKAWDPYWVRVEIMTDSGPVEVMARGSHQRELAGQHRAAVDRVLRGEESPSALDRFRGKRVGGHELVTDFERLSTLVEGGALDQLDSLYVLPETHA